MARKAPLPPTYRAPDGFRTMLAKLLAGFQQEFPAELSLATAQGPLTRAATLQKLQAALALYDALDRAKAQVADLELEIVYPARAALHQGLPAAHALFKSLKASLIGYYGSGAPQLERFGIAPQKPAKLSAIKGVLRAARVRRTRAENGTLGKQQKRRLQQQQDLEQYAGDLVPKKK